MSDPVTFSDEEDCSMDNIRGDLPDIGDDNDDSPFGQIQKNLSVNSGLGRSAIDAEWKMSNRGLNSDAESGTGSGIGSTGTPKSSSRRKSPAVPARPVGRPSRTTYKDDLDLSPSEGEDDLNDSDVGGLSGGSSDDDFETSSGSKRTPKRGSGGKTRSRGRGKSSGKKGRSGSGGRKSKARGGRSSSAKKPPVVEEVFLEEEEADYEIENILAKKIERGKVLYFLSWKGFDASHNSWEPMENLNCPDLIEAYESKERAKKQAGSGISPPGGPKYRPGPASRTKKREFSPPPTDNHDAKKSKVATVSEREQSDDDIENVNFEAEADDFQSYEDNDEVEKSNGNLEESGSAGAAAEPEEETQENATPVAASESITTTPIESDSAKPKSKKSTSVEKSQVEHGSPECIHCSKRIYQGNYRKKYTLATKLAIPTNLNVYEGLSVFYTHYKGAYPLIGLEPIGLLENENRFICNSCAEMLEGFCNSLLKFTEASCNVSLLSQLAGNLQEEKDDWFGLLPGPTGGNEFGTNSKASSSSVASKKYYPEDKLAGK